MKNLLVKIKNNLKQRGLKKTLAMALAVIKARSLTEKKKIKLLGKYIDQHNRAYEKISELAVSLNKGIHPKHDIMKYHQFFLDNIKPNDRVLDAGSGTGLVAMKIAQKAKYVLGVDFNPKSIEEAKEKYKKDSLEFLVADLNEYKPVEKFDKVVLSNVLEHIDNRVKLLKNLREIAPIILLRVPMLSRDWLTVYKKLMGFEYRLDPTHETEYTIEEIENELNESGWKIKNYQINWGEWWGVIEHD